MNFELDTILEEFSSLIEKLFSCCEIFEPESKEKEEYDEKSITETKRGLELEAKGMVNNLRRPDNPNVDLNFVSNHIGSEVYKAIKNLIRGDVVCGTLCPVFIGCETVCIAVTWILIPGKFTTSAILKGILHASTKFRDMYSIDPKPLRVITRIKNF